MTSPSSDWVEAALNGGSTRASRWWVHEEGDLLAGEVVQIADAVTQAGIQHKVLTVRAEQATEAGFDVDAGEWLKLTCHYSVLRRWVERDEPTIGDKVAVRYRGKARGELDYVAGTYRGPEGWA